MENCVIKSLTYKDVSGGITSESKRDTRENYSNIKISYNLTNDLKLSLKASPKKICHTTNPKNLGKYLKKKVL